MLYKIVPMISKKGLFARYYGGYELQGVLEDKPASPVHTTFLAICVLFQASMYCFKKIQQRKITNSLVNKARNQGKCILEKTWDSHWYD